MLYKCIFVVLPPHYSTYPLLTMSAQTTQKLILVIGATGAQGLAVIDGLLKPAADGSPSPYAIRALTRNVTSPRAQELARRGAEIFEGVLRLGTQTTKRT